MSLVVSGNGQCVHSVGRATRWLGWAACMSTAPTDEFTVRFTWTRGAPAGNEAIGLIHSSVYRPNTHIAHVDGVYTLAVATGKLYGSGTYNKRYCGGKGRREHRTVRCVYDRGAGLISFHVDGVECGVAYCGVAGPLHAFVEFGGPGQDCEIVE